MLYTPYTVFTWQEACRRRKKLKFNIQKNWQMEIFDVFSMELKIKMELKIILLEASIFRKCYS